jgi:hypothetical protein
MSDMNTPKTFSMPSRMDRREAIKWMMTAVASTTLLERDVFAAAATSSGKPAVGYGTDPDVIKAYKPGDVWPRTFTDAQRTTAAALCDVIMPADAKGPGASAVRVQDFIDEWISAPYGEAHTVDRRTITEGLAWLDQEAQKRFKNPFAKLSDAQKTAICDDICYVPNAKPEFRQGAQFFRRFRDLTAGGYYTTPEGMRDIGYTGNVAMDKFEIPTEVLKKLGLA